MLRVIRSSSQKFKVTVAQWNKEAYFMMKSNTINDNRFCNFIKLLDQELKSRLAKIAYEQRMIVIFDNTGIYKTKKVKIFNKKLGCVVFTNPPYSSQLNQIENTFKILNSMISKKT